MQDAKRPVGRGGHDLNQRSTANAEQFPKYRDGLRGLVVNKR
ncbi:hypothetical protein NK6_9703 [Bradyrhizobium diazoefficiens]|uniref:Uncharacterized protein n=1 Tax=Bradyrhizobium diazoefficiens TaxID=1355477 RepID=A0A0E4BWL1_9BRAD|nr:hypothetical protein NK6_9703 [Bradyrhizobium diazoefficiens]